MYTSCQLSFIRCLTQIKFETESCRFTSVCFSDKGQNESDMLLKIYYHKKKIISDADLEFQSLIWPKKHPCNGIQTVNLFVLWNNNWCPIDMSYFVIKPLFSYCSFRCSLTWDNQRVTLSGYSTWSTLISCGRVRICTRGVFFGHMNWCFKNLHPSANLHPGANLLLLSRWRNFICTRVQFLHMNAKCFIFVQLDRQFWYKAGFFLLHSCKKPIKKKKLYIF